MKAAETNTPAVATEEYLTFHDFKNSILVVSLLMNAFVFTTWLTLQVTDQYNTAMAHFLFG